MITYPHFIRMLLGGLLLISQISYAVVIDNDKTKSQGGYFSVDVGDAGETRTVLLTDPDATRQGEDIAYDYESYVVVNGVPSRLAGTAPVTVGDDADRLSSNGSFTGSDGNTISWTIESSIANDSLQMRNVLPLQQLSAAA
jgi:hypothetical protein